MLRRHPQRIVDIGFRRIAQYAKVRLVEQNDNFMGQRAHIESAGLAVRGL